MNQWMKAIDDNGKIAVSLYKRKKYVELADLVTSNPKIIGTTKHFLKGRFIEYYSWPKRPDHIKYMDDLGRLKCLKSDDSNFLKSVGLMHAAAGGANLEVFKWLEEQGLDIFEKNIDTVLSNGILLGGQQPFYLALVNKNLSIAQYLLDRGQHINSKGRDGLTALHMVAHKGHLDCVEWLVQRGAKVNARDIHGNTPLHLVCIRNTGTSVAKYLLENGANLLAIDKIGETALDMAKKMKKLKLIAYLKTRT